MGTIPRWLIRRDTATIEAWQGEGPDGPTFAAPVTVECYVENKAKAARGTDGTQVMSAAVLYARLGPDAPALSRVTLSDGRVTTVMQPWPATTRGLPTPDHLELLLV
ncbi:hypothetical protein [Streptomyces sp. NPDC020983]|uniref:hypothetical protein n=1 Tax=Streptomyces sp. NPDC020983 TaxID=3365106 RepID=UPI0037B4720A